MHAQDVLHSSLASCVKCAPPGFPVSKCRQSGLIVRLMTLVHRNDVPPHGYAANHPLIAHSHKEMRQALQAHQALAIMRQT